MRYLKYTRMLMVAFLLTGILIYTPAQAITVTVDPVTQDLILGNQAIVDVIIYGYAPGPPTNIAIGAFDFDITYDPALLGFDSLVFGSSLGNPPSGAITGFNNNSATGVLNIFETSLLPVAALYALQGQAWPDDHFIAATLTFNTLSAGLSPLEIVIKALPDEFGNPFPDNYSDPGSVSARAVPEPTTMLLLGLGLVGLVGANRKYKP